VAVPLQAVKCDEDDVLPLLHLARFLTPIPQDPVNDRIRAAPTSVPASLPADSLLT
jgi:hypothetical protein